MNLIYCILIGISGLALYLSFRKSKPKPGDTKKLVEFFNKPIVSDEPVILTVGDWYINVKNGKSLEIVSIGEVSVRVREEGARSSHNVHKSSFHKNHEFEEEA